MKNFRNILLGCLLSTFTTGSFSQILETRQLISINAGNGTVTGNEDHLFFPSSINQKGLNVDLSYEHKINSYLAGGISIGYNHFARPNDQPGFAEINTYGSTFLTVGPRIVLHSPYKYSGLFNRIRIGLALTPQFHYYSGERSLNIDNEIILENGGETEQPTIEMNAKSSGFGAKVGPEINCRITQRVGLKLSYNLQLLSVYTGYEREQLVANSVVGGLIFTFGNKKSLF